MNSKFLKVWYIVAGSFTGLSLIYYIVRIFDAIFNKDSIEGTLLDKLNLYAIILLCVAFVMLLCGGLLAKAIEKKVSQKESTKVEESELLMKYKSKKK